LLERADYIAGRKKLTHAVSLNADQPINRAMVAGCAIYATGNYLKFTHAENIKSPLVQPSCQNAKVVEAFCDAGLSTPYRPLVCQPPLDALRVPADMPTAPLGSPAGRHPRCLVLVSSFPSKAAQHAILIEFCC